MARRTLQQRRVAARKDIADLHTYSPLPGNTEGRLDPFLLLNHHGPQTVTFILAGELAHQTLVGTTA